MAAPTVKSPAGNDSDNVLIWKAMLNLWIYAHLSGVNTPIPTLGSSDTVNLTRGVQALQAIP